MWVKTLDLTDGKDLFVNALTKERVKDMYQYDGSGIQRMQGLHSYVAPSNKLMYRKRRMWLSICKVPEWESADDVETGWIFYRNNISGETQWDMPLAVDTFGEADKLEVLNLSNNSMKAMCNSLCRMTHLRRIMVQKNRLHSLPAEIGNLLELEYLNVSDNELKLFPPSLVQCVSLREIHCQGNQIIRLPDLLGTLPALEKIDASANRLKVIPPSLGYSKLWREYAFQDNPLEDPPMSEVLLGLERLKWYLRQRYMIIERGMPPPMIFNQISIMYEVTVLKPELMMRVRHMIEVNERNGPMENILNLQLLGLTEIPKEIVLYKDIKMLRLDYNNKIEIDRIDGLPDSFSGLRMLSIRACNLSYFPENCTILKRIQSLTLEENLLESLPKKFGQLRTLKELNISKNRLYSLPEKLHGLTSLKSLNLENNFLERLPESLGNLKTITTLNISKNRLLELPEKICDMKGLKKLNIERNDLLNLPIGLSELRLLELKIGHNRIEGLRDEFFSGHLGQTIKLFSCAENNLSELPTSLCEIDPNGFLDAELNPLYSPPPGLLSEELVVIQNYLRVRSIRIDEIEELLTEEDFTFSRESASPFASEVLEDGTGYLSPYDLSEFDRAIDEYVNGDFFKCPASGFEIVNNLANLRDKRENDLYETILNTIDHVLDKVSKDSPVRFSVAVYNKSTRPWGRKGEMVTVHVLSWDAYLNPAPRSSYHPEGRAALIDLVRDALPPMAFPLTTELILDCVNLFSSPYGQVAAIEEIEYSKCDCVEEKKGRIRASMHKPCRKASLVLLSSIYTQEEATRREEEDDVFMDIFEEIEEQVRFWVQTDEGKVFHKKICKQRRAELVEEISLREEMLMGTAAL
jgi:Leucine-rich repeat (LRR) protein